ncbi:hypothetical protein ACU4GD_00550 [Cupriavidus basilensis]
MIMMAGGLMNILPWGGPTARAASALGVDVGLIFVPMILPMIVTGCWGLFVAPFCWGAASASGSAALRRAAADPASAAQPQVTAGDPDIARPGLAGQFPADPGTHDAADSRHHAVAGTVHGGLALALMSTTPQPPGPEGGSSYACRQYCSRGVADLRCRRLRGQLCRRAPRWSTRSRPA